MHIHWPGGGSLVQLESASTLSFCGEGRYLGLLLVLSCSFFEPT